MTLHVLFIGSQSYARIELPEGEEARFLREYSSWLATPSLKGGFRYTFGHATNFVVFANIAAYRLEGAA